MKLSLIPAHAGGISHIVTAATIEKQGRNGDAKADGKQYGKATHAMMHYKIGIVTYET